MNYSRIGLIGLLFFFINSCAQNQWTWFYKKIFKPSEIELHLNRSCLLFCKRDTPNFTQLIFTWNAFRPQKGYFKFKVRVRDAKKKTWYPWHTMAEWGVNIQRSFFDKTLFDTQFHHVRLEMPSFQFADALNIKIEACNEADIPLLKGLYVCISDLNKFKSELCENSEVFDNLAPTHIELVPALSQMILNHSKKEALCSPTSCSMLLSYLLKESIDPVLFAQGCHDKGLGAFGSWPFNTAHAYELCNGTYGFAVRRLPSFSTLHKLLQKKLPVIVSVRGSLDGAPKEYNNGHLLVVVGYEASTKKVICHDPAFESNEKTCISYNLSCFLKAWERSHRLAYVVDVL